MLKDKVVEWTRNYLNSFGGKTKAIIGISGGKDSTVAAKVCVEAVGADRVIGVLMPQGEQHDIDVSYAVCKELGIKYYEINIDQPCYKLAIQVSRAMGINTEDYPVYYSNTPARIRMATLYGVAAIVGDARVVNTCNRSEDYVGYSTKFGDSAGDFSPLMTLTVREVKFLGYQLGLPMELIEKKPEDGLSGKTDEDNLGFSYNTLDDYLLHDIKPSNEVLDNIERRHKANLHKLEPMPHFDIEKIKCIFKYMKNFEFNVN